MWDQRYQEDAVYGRKANQFLKDHQDYFPKEGRVLCIGAGQGRNAIYLAALGFNVDAVDASSVGLEKTNQIAKERGLTLTTIHQDLENFEFKANHYDMIIEIFCHLSNPLRTKVHQALKHSLKYKGIYLNQSYVKEQLEFNTGGPKNDAQLYSLDEIKENLSGLDFLIARQIIRDIHEGKYHNGKSAVLEIIARRVE